MLLRIKDISNSISVQRNHKFIFPQRIIMNHFSPDAKTLFSSQVMKDRAMLKIKAHQNPSICMPSTKYSAIRMTIVLITNAKNPSVRIVKGSPNNWSIGFTTTFRMPKTMAKIIAVEKLSKWTPDRNFVSPKATIAVINNLTIIPIKQIFRN